MIEPEFDPEFCSQSILQLSDKNVAGDSEVCLIGFYQNEVGKITYKMLEIIALRGFFRQNVV
ncbi:hypothetical protein HMI56_000292 [Coelomomyces lativittatus]|nr:hypothetical protein HMI56_000292 [Coelomomyces lativittatus]